MTQKFLYIVDYFVPEPFSDGGLLNVIAENDDNCFDVITEWDGGDWTQYYGKLRENIMKSPRLLLSESESHETQIVEAFVT